jgi:hypothetical protein
MPANSQRAYDDKSEFNAYIDDLHERVRIFNEEFAPSRVLFELAPEPYRLYLAEYELAPDAEENEPEAPQLESSQQVDEAHP